MRQRKTLITVNKNGRADLPAWAVNAVWRMSRRRSRRYRHVKKAVKKQFMLLILQILEEGGSK